MPFNLLIAIGLLLLTAFPAYFIWYVARGRHLRRKKQEKEKEKEVVKKPAKKPKGRWGVDNDSYCYPEINDVMGYEFIKVVQVPDELKEGKNAKKTSGTDWDRSNGLGLQNEPGSVVTTTTSDSGGQEDYYPGETPKHTTAKPAHVREEGEPERENETQLDDVNPTDLEDFERAEAWRNYDHEGSLPPDDELESILENNEDMFSDETDPEEAARVEADLAMIKGFNEMNQRMIDAESRDYSEMVNEILSKVSEPDSAYNGSPDKDDIPDID